MIPKLECVKPGTILDTPIEYRSDLKCDTRDLERKILPVDVPCYTTCHTPVVATGKEGTAPDELYWSPGVTIHEETHLIFVVNGYNDRVEIFFETEEFISQVDVGQLSNPYGIAIHGDSLYVSCEGDDTVSQFSLIEMCLVRRIGGKGSNNGQFDWPQQLTTDLIGRVFMADCSNDRICVHDPDLNHLRNITHPPLSRPEDIKVSSDCLYVLCPLSNPCMIVLTLEGDMLHSLIASGEGMDV